MVRWLRWHCPPDTGFEIRALAVWGRARYLSVTEAPHNTNFHTWMGKKQFCFFQTAETGNRTPDSGVKGSGANHYPRAPALLVIASHVYLMLAQLVNVTWLLGSVEVYMQSIYHGSCLATTSRKLGIPIPTRNSVDVTSRSIDLDTQPN